jgi:hypothetical protein
VSFAGDTVVVAIQADGLLPRARYTAHLHSGTPRAPSASAGQLGSVDTDGSGRLRLQATEAVIYAGAHVPLSTELLFNGEHFVDLHDANGTVTATSRLPRLTSE